MPLNRRRLLPLLPLALMGAIPGCGGLPQPYRGNPGAVARRLAAPPAYRLAIPPPQDALLTDAAAADLARVLADALIEAEVPAVDGAPLALDWRLVVEAESTGQNGGTVLPRYSLEDADGTQLGGLDGAPVPARDWVEGAEPTLRQAAAEVAPRLADLLARVDAERRTGDERAVGGGPPVIRLLPVKGAPGDGNRSLTTRMREQLAGLGFAVQDGAQGAEFGVEGQVQVARGTGGPGLQRIEIVWIVSRRDLELGRVLQLNEVPAGSLDGLWGDVAYVVAEEAAGGVRDVIANAGGGPEAPAEAAAAGAPAAPAGTDNGAAPAEAASPRR